MIVDSIIYAGGAKPCIVTESTSGSISEFETELATLRNDHDELGDQVSAIQQDINALKSTTITKSDKHGVQADYALHYGILDCPNDLISFSANNKDITINPGIVLQAAGTEYKTTIASSVTYTIEETGDVVLFFTRTESEGGTIQVGFIEAGEVYYQEEEPEDGVTSFLAWWQPVEKTWRFKSVYTGNVWRTAVATPLANIKAGDTGITSINYIGYRILDDDNIAHKSDIESLTNLINDLTTRLTALENKT